jgi:peptide-methionine (S)-S-oxide reductase
MKVPDERMWTGRQSSRLVIALGLLTVATFGFRFALAQPNLRRFPKFDPLPAPSDSESNEQKLAKATFGGGCFWCTEAVYEQLKGVQSVVSGYSGGYVPNPTYRAVLTGITGHAEVIQLTYDPRVISYPELLEVFWYTHDPTTLNRQGPDVGTQYRSVIFCHNDEQRKLAEQYKKKLDESGAWRRPVVTEISRFQQFYPAEKYHQDYYRLNAQEPYCSKYVKPKVKKFKRVFREKLKSATDSAASRTGRSRTE